MKYVIANYILIKWLNKDNGIFSLYAYLGKTDSGLETIDYKFNNDSFED
ncbi:MAG: hypothetical protein MUF58_06400 [Arcicella sp.]|jgi:hypothetical protein|nr:hypothetical protein [Arcicella sp.]